MSVDLTKLLPAAVIVAVFVTVLLTEIIKKADKKDKLKGYRIYIPAILSLLCLLSASSSSGSKFRFIGLRFLP